MKLWYVIRRNWRGNAAMYWQTSGTWTRDPTWARRTVNLEAALILADKKGGQVVAVDENGREVRD